METDGAIWRGVLRKMAVAAEDPVRYTLADAAPAGGARAPDLPLNERLGTAFVLRHTGRILCVLCGRVTKRSFGQGFCYSCFRGRAEADLCIVKPERCHYFDKDDPCRDEAFARSHCFQPHVLYAALTSACKVGITRKANLPARWIDQGAVRAIPLAELPSRREVGLLEHRLAQRFRDCTHWLAMLREAEPAGDLDAFAAAVLAQLADWGVAGVLPPDERRERRFRYPWRGRPDRFASFDLGKHPEAGGLLRGIKGQYLIFEGGVINLRAFSGYEVKVFA